MKRCDATTAWAALQGHFEAHGRDFDLREAFAQYYAGQSMITVSGGDGAPTAGAAPGPAFDGTLAASELTGTCRLHLYVVGNDAQMTIVSVFDNLGKGASGAAVQNLDLMLAADRQRLAA